MKKCVCGRVAGFAASALVLTLATPGLAEVTWWAVPAMSEEQRLPDTVPTDGEKGGTVRIVAAKGEYEPGSFVVRSDRDLGKVKLELSEFKREEGRGNREQGAVVFPKENLDLKVIKVWYQNKNGWFTYFADTGFKLCPELLLNDEDLIRVDTEKEANYARLTEKDGRTHEFWLNPPRQMNRRFFGYYIGSQAFQPMRENFRDAETLQPVTLAKNVSKQFFLTAHVTKDIPAGVYRGEVEIKGGGGQWKIPVALRVLDFELPKPMAYRHPEMEMLISSYNYSNPGRIQLENGGDGKRAWKQFENVLKNMVAHGQNMHWMYGDRAGEPGTERIIDTMKRAGMRTDVLMGGVSFNGLHGNGYSNTAYSAALAQRQSEYYDRVHGHHNIYCNYDDEPGYRRLKQDRYVFDAYKDYGGFKFALACQGSILWKIGYMFDWHNMATNPIEDYAPAKWNELGLGTHCGWYAQDHVGTENPAFNRRQYGLGAWLTGYTAFCNYAHHFGPYNDDSDTYKPMVFAYGCGDGVIDTLAWEGFREGIDDIRYATYMLALARVAQKSTDIDVRRLGGKAVMYLGAFQRACDDLNMGRAEIVRFIEELRAALGPKAAVTIAAAKEVPTARKPLPKRPDPAAKPVKTDKEACALAQEWVNRNDLEKAIAVHRSLMTSNAPIWQVDTAIRRIGELYCTFFQREKAFKWYMDHKKPLLAAGVIAGRDEKADAQAEKMRQQVFLDEKETPGVRREAWMKLLGTEFADRTFDAYLKLFKKPQEAANGFLALVTREGSNPVHNGNWAFGRTLLDYAERAEGENTNRVWDAKLATYAADICNVAGDRAGALKYLGRAMRSAARAEAAKKPWKPEDVFFVKMTREMLEASGSVDALAKRFAEANAKLGAGIDPAKRKDAIEKVGSFAMCAGEEDKVRALDRTLKAMIRPFDTKVYAMRYAPKGVYGLGGWAAAAADAKPETAKLDRPYGGDSMQFLETDVTSGDRGDVQKDLSKTYERTPEWQGMFDDWGVHFRLEIFDEKAPEIAARLLSAGTMEGYLAPGENTPYVCLLHDIRPGGFSIHNTMYDQPNHRRIDSKDRVNCREEIRYTTDSIVIYWAFSWDKYATKVPTDGFCWDFEPCLWGRKASCTWNGLKTIHGRSSWGKLRFEMPEATRLAVMKKVLISARARYNREKVSPSMSPEGVIEHWSDPEVGDLKFYGEVLKPVVDELDAAAEKVSLDMDAATVKELEEKALPGWHDFRFLADRLRAEYLRKAQAK